MAIVSVRPDAVIENLTNPVANTTVYVPAFETDEPNSVMHGLLQYVEGYPWTVNYYGQLLGKNNDLKDFDPAIVDSTQAYYKIENLVLRVESPLTSDYNMEINTTTIIGTAFVPRSVSANVGDVILATIEDGELCAFRITKVERKTHRKTSVYSIDYSFMFMVATNKNWFNSLNQRVQQTYFYHQDRESLGINSRVTPNQNEAILKVREFLVSSKKSYFKTFFNHTKMTLVLPKQKQFLYDFALVNFIRKITNTNDAVELQKMLLLTSNNNPLISQRTIWDAIYEREPELLYEINKKHGFVSSRSFRGNVKLGGLAYLSFDYILYPEDPDLTTSVGFIPSISTFYDIKLNDQTTSQNPDINLLTITTVNGDKVPVLNELFKNRYYLVSQDFYELNTKKSYFEIIVGKFIRREVISIIDVAMLLDSYNSWSRLQQFYFLPALWYILTIVLHEDVL